MRNFRKCATLVIMAFIVPIFISNAQANVSSLDTTIESAVWQDGQNLSIQGNIATSTARQESVYLQAVVLDEEGVTRDQVVYQEEISPGESFDATISFGISPVSSDKLVLMTVDEMGTPLDVDPILVEWGNDVSNERPQGMMDIIACEHLHETQQLSCIYQGDTADAKQATVRLYDGQPYTGSVIAERTDAITFNEDRAVFTAFSAQEEDGLYTYTITDERGSVLHKGSVRTGDIFTEADEAYTQDDFLMTLAALSFGFFTLVVMIAQFLLNPNRSRYVWISIGAIILAFLGYWAYANAITFESTNYPQYVYTVSSDAVDSYTTDSGEEATVYWITFTAHDTYTGTPPMRQQVDITLDGTTYEQLIDSNTGETAHVREITIIDSEENTTAIKVVDGCGSYYNHSIGNIDRYGRYDCTPEPLLVDDAVVGCLDPNATNYDPDAIISSEQCDYRGCTIPSALNYDPSATINDGSCEIEGCTIPSALNYDPSATINDGSCEIEGCTNIDAINYDPSATIDDGSCICEGGECADIYGCTNPDALNYDPSATIDDGSCICEGGECADIYGCTDPGADNYDPNATVNDGSCNQCFWMPAVPDPSTFCSTELYYQTNSCTGESRSIQGLLDTRWVPNVDPSDICIGYSITQTQQCSSLATPPTRILEGTSNDPFCIRPTAGFEVSTNLINWSTCDAMGRIQMTRGDQVLYVREAATEPASAWEISQVAGEITGEATRYQGSIWEIEFDYLVNKKQYDDVNITMISPADNRATQSCDLSLLNFEFEER